MAALIQAHWSIVEGSIQRGSQVVALPLTVVAERIPLEVGYRDEPPSKAPKLPTLETRRASG